MVKIGLTGGAGAGKDEAARVLRSQGAKIINADEIGHRLLEKDRALQKKLVRTFGQEILGPEGKIDRKKLGTIVFGNKSKIRLLNRAIHPLMKREFKREIAECRRKGIKIVVLNAAILFEAGWDKLVDRVILITAPEKLRIKRLLKKGIPLEKALAIFSSQWSDERKKRMADFVINNDSSIADLKKKIMAIPVSRGVSNV